MELAINGLRLMGRRYGVGRYIEYLLRHWSVTDHPFTRIIVYTPGPVDLNPWPFARIEHRIVPTSRSSGYWEQVVLARLRKQHDILFCPSYVIPIMGTGKTVVTHLGSYEALPSAFPLLERWKSRLLYQLSATRADRVITVSESSKRDIVRFYGASPDKVSVIYLGVDPLFRPIMEEDLLVTTRKRYFGFDRPYILFVGKLSARRNIPELIAAYGALRRTKRIPHGLLLVGSDTIGQNIPHLAQIHGVSADVVHQDFASHEELVQIYNAADLFIYPSSYEGFGIPVLEAMACGVPTITLRNSSFLEFAADIVYLARDGSTPQLFEAIEHVLSSQDLRIKMKTTGPIQAQRFGWASISSQTMAVLTAVANS